MLKIDDWVLNQKTGRLGRVIGYGHQILDSAYMTTLKVQVAGATGCTPSIEEDLFSAWTRKEQ